MTTLSTTGQTWTGLESIKCLGNKNHTTNRLNPGRKNEQQNVLACNVPPTPVIWRRNYRSWNGRSTQHAREN